MTRRNRPIPTPMRRLLAALLLSAISLHAADAILLQDDFSRLAPGMFSTGVIGAQVEYHYLPVVAPKGGWAVSNFRSEGSQRAWRVIDDGGRRALQHTDTAAPSDVAYMHNIVVAGDGLWRDYTLTAEFAPDSTAGQSGVVFLYQTDRAHYFAGVSGGKAVLKLVHGGKSFRVLNEVVLAEAPFTWQPGAGITVRITTGGGKLRAEFTGGPVLEATDSTFALGRVGVTADIPARFHRIEVTCPPAAQA